MKEEKTGLDEAVSVTANTAQVVSGMVKTGKAVSSAAKGAAVGGPYGAVAGALWSARHHLMKIVAALLVLLMLPVLFIVMLPSIIFGGLTGAAEPGSSQPVLNDSAAITENINEISFAVNQILGEGIDDVEDRIAQDFAGTNGDEYEVINPYEGDLVSNTNLFLSQYCAARDQDFEAISLSDMEQTLRQGLPHLYSYTRTSETRTVEDDNPETPDVVETTTELWYIYTIVYNGEDYFADAIFGLSDAQKELAENYAQNLSLFLGDGMFQHSGESEGIPSLGNVRYRRCHRGCLFQPAGRTVCRQALWNGSHRRIWLRPYRHVHCGLLLDR